MKHLSSLESEQKSKRVRQHEILSSENNCLAGKSLKKCLLCGIYGNGSFFGINF